MDTIFTIDSEKKLFLYTCGSLICLRTAIGTDLTRQIILANDYATSLSAVTYRGTVHFSYQNTQGDLVLRNILDATILYRLPASETPDCFSPVLLSFCDKLLLLYFVKNPLNEQFLLKLSYPLDATDILFEEKMYATLPHLQFIHAQNQLLISCSTNNRTDYYFLDEGNGLTSFVPQASLQVEQELAKSRTLIREWENKILSETEEWKQKIAEKEKLILSAKKQYDELMDTATRYRDEATKWHNKYYAIRNK